MTPAPLREVNSLFQQPWWLDAVAPRRWSEAAVTRGGQVVARLPYMIEHRAGLTLLRQPPLTQTLGPWVALGEGSPAGRLADFLELLESLIESLPRCDYFAQCFHHSMIDALPFHWHGFDIEVRYTHIITELAAAADPTYYRGNIRREIKKAQRDLVVRSDLDLDRLISLSEMSFKRHGLRLPYDPNVLRRIDRTCQERGQSRAFFAEDARGQLHAAVYLVWDERAAYYLLGGADPDHRTSGAHSLLIWEAIKFAAGVSKSFDFEGSMNRDIGRFFRAFGAQLRPFLFVTRENWRFSALQRALSLGGRFRGRLW